MTLVKVSYIFTLYGVTFTKHPDHYISYMSYERLHKRAFPYKGVAWRKPRFHDKYP